MITRILPIQDTYIIGSGSTVKELNVGRDEILCLGSCDGENIARILVQFDTNAVSSSLPSESVDFKATMHFYQVAANNLPVSYSIKCNNLLESWTEGLGTTRTIEHNGASWVSRNGTQNWTNAGGTFNTSSIASASFLPSDYRQDLSIDITDNVRTTGTNGYILMLSDEQSASELETNIEYFSLHSHTVYKPYLEIIYDDSVQDSTLSTLSLDQVGHVTTTLSRECAFGEKVNTVIQLSPRYPERVYSTDTIHKASYILPEDSYWGIKDEYTNEMIIPFSEGTKLSSNDYGNYFTLDTSLLEPERYYRLIFGVGNLNKLSILDNRNIFKVVRYGRLN